MRFWEVRAGKWIDTSTITAVLYAGQHHHTATSGQVGSETLCELSRSCRRHTDVYILVKVRAAGVSYTHRVPVAPADGHTVDACYVAVETLVAKLGEVFEDGH